MIWYSLCYVIVSANCVMGLDAMSVLIYEAGIFQVFTQVAGPGTVLNSLAFDTGGSRTWLYQYKYVRDVLGYPSGGYSVTRLRTRIDPPRGGVDIKYGDGSQVRASVWTVKEFKIGDHSWSQPFGIVDREEERAPRIFTGLLGASRSSHFAKTHPVFGFHPVSPGRLLLHLSRQNASEVCKTGEFTFFSLSLYGRYTGQWATDAVVKFGKVAFNTGILLDTGSSVISLNSEMFEKFREQLDSSGIPVSYDGRLMLGKVSCHLVDRMPSLVIRQGSQVILVTPRMYASRKVGEVGGKCLVAVVGHDTDYTDHGMILGVPALGWLVSEFDSQNNRMGLCAPVKSIVEDEGVLDPDLFEFQDCPTCDRKSSEPIKWTAGFITLLLIIV